MALDILDNILVFLIFPKSRWFFANCSSLTYIILSFLLQSYSDRITACVNLWLSPLKHQKVEKQEQQQQQQN